jgi:apolipoprotein N-acyltransferase
MGLSLPVIALGAVFYCLSFSPWGYYFFSFICLIPLLWVSSRAQSWRHAFFAGTGMGFLVTQGGFSWAYTAIHSYSQMPRALCLLAYFIFSIFNHVHLGLFSCFVFFLFQRLNGPKGLLWELLGVVSGFIVIETGVPRLFVDALGNCLIESKSLSQLAEFSGVSLLSGLIVVVNFLTFKLLQTKKGPRKQSLALIGVLSLVVLSSFLGGDALRSKMEKTIDALHQTQKPFRVAVIQANIADPLKIASEKGFSYASEFIQDAYLALSEQVLHEVFTLKTLPSVDAIIWPETAFFGVYPEPKSFGTRQFKHSVEKLVQIYQIPFLIGGYDEDQDDDNESFENKNQFNSFFAVLPKLFASDDGSTHNLQTYHKTHLLYFSEVIPGVKWFPKLAQIVPTVANFGRGSGPLLFQVGGISIQPGICYEDLINEFSRKGAQMGANLFINVTNDSWFGKKGALQHLSLARLRSIETRRYMIRATNSGFSTLINPLGEVTDKTEFDQKTVLYANAYPVFDSRPTFFTTFGDWFSGSCLAFLLLALSAIAFQRYFFKPR